MDPIEPGWGLGSELVVLHLKGVVGSGLVSSN